MDSCADVTVWVGCQSPRPQIVHVNEWPAPIGSCEQNADEQPPPPSKTNFSLQGSMSSSTSSSASPSRADSSKFSDRRRPQSFAEKCQRIGEQLDKVDKRISSGETTWTWRSSSLIDRIAYMSVESMDDSRLHQALCRRAMALCHRVAMSGSESAARDFYKVIDYEPEQTKETMEIAIKYMHTVSEALEDIVCQLGSTGFYESKQWVTPELKRALGNLYRTGTERQRREIIEAVQLAARADPSSKVVELLLDCVAS